MTNLNLFDALEICLQALDQGLDLESCLVRFPALADDLRPILTTAIQAHSEAVTDIPADAMRRGRARVLQVTAEMREQNSAAPALPFWRRPQKGFFGARFYRLAITTAAMLGFLLTGGTGLVNASNNALPGDHLYPVKRSWEDVRLLFVFDSNTRVQLENEFDHERVQEIEELYTKKQIAQVNFQGVVSVQDDNRWVIDGLNVDVNDDTSLGKNIRSGSKVQIIGETDDGVVNAQQISLIATPGIEPGATFNAPAQPGASRTPESTEVQNNNADDNQQPEGTPEISNPTSQPGDDGSQSNPTATRRPGEKKPGNGGTGSGNDNNGSGNGNGNDNNGSDNGNDAGGSSNDNSNGGD